MENLYKKVQITEINAVRVNRYNILFVYLRAIK